MFLVAPRLAEAGLLDINATLLVELVAFIVMIVLLGRYAYPRILDAAESRQKATIEALEAAENERREAEQRLREADERLREASRQAQEIIDRANRGGEEVRAELRRRGEEESGRIVERAKREIEGERNQALESIRTRVADLVVEATEKVVGASLDDQRHRQLIEDAIQEVGVEANGRGQG